MLNYDTAIKSTTTSLESQLSATREQEKYNQSLEARLNRLNTAWYSFASSMGEDILYDGIVTVTTALEKLTNVGDSAVVQLGALPILFGTMGTGLFLLSGRLTAYTGNLITNIATQKLASASTGTLTASMYGLAAGTGAASTAFRTLLMATGVGAVLVGLGVVISGLTSTISENIQKQEEFDNQQKKNIDALTANKEQVSQLISEYERLSYTKSSSDSWDAEQEKEYLDVQQKLGELFPSLISHIDSTGQAHLKNKEAIQEEIRATEELIDAQNRMIIENASEEFGRLIDELNGNAFDSFSNFIYGSLKSQIEQQKNIIEAMYENGADSGALAEAEFELKRLERQYQQTSEQIKGYIFEVADAVSDIEIDSNLTNVLQDFIYSLDLSNLDNNELESFAKEFGRIQEELQRALDSGNKGLFNSTVQDLNNLASETSNFDGKLNGLTIQLDETNKKLLESDEIIRVDTELTDEYGESIDGATESLDEYVSKLQELSTVAERITGISSKQVSETEDLIYIYQTLNQMTDKTAEQEAMLLDAKNKLIAIYPHLFKNNDIQIEKIIEENKANETLIKAYELAKEGKLTAEQEMTLAQANGTRARIENIKAEIKAMESLNGATYDKYEELMAKYESGQELTEHEQRFLYGASQSRGNFTGYTEYAERLAELDELTNNLNTDVDGLSNTVKEYEESQSKSKSTTEKSIYVTDEYRQALEKLNLEIEKQQSLQAKLPEHSEEYRKSLQSQIRLEQQKLALQESQAKALDKQIKSGNVLQTGKITTSSSSKVSGNSTEAQIWNFFKSQGLSDSATAGIMGNLQQESGLSTTAVNKSSGATGIAQWMGGRLNNLKSYAKSVGTAWTDLNTQLEWLWKELNGADSTTKAILNKYGGISGFNQMNASQSAKVFEEAFERSGGSALSKRQSNAQSFYNRYSGSNVSSVSSEVADTQEAIDKAKSDLNSIQSDILSQKQLIEELELSLVNSQLESFNYKMEQYQRILDYEDAKIQSLDSTSSRYGATLERNISYMEKMQNVNQRELNYLNELIKNGNLSGKTLEEMKVKAEELSTEMLSLSNSIQETNANLVEFKMNQFNEYIDDIGYALSRSQVIAGLMDEGSADWNNEMEYQINLLKENQASIESQRETLKQLLQTQNLSAETVKNYKEQLEELSLEYWNLEKSIVDTSKSIDETSERLAEENARNLWEIYKKYEEQKKDEKLKSLDDELKYEQKRHDRVMENYQEERDLFRKNVQERLDLIDQQEAERDYNMEIDDLESQRRKITDQLNLLSLDDSNEAKSQRKKLQEELDKIDKDIAEKRHDRDIELQKESLNSLLENKEEEISELEKKADERFEKEKETIDKQKDYWTQYYDELINDERKFAEIKEQIVSGNFDALSEEFQGYIDELEATMPELEFSLSSSMETVGTAIRENVIDNLKEAIELLNQIQVGSTSGSSKYASSSNSSKSAVGTNIKNLSTADAQVLAGKFLTDKVRSQAESASQRLKIQEKGHELASLGRSNGSSISVSKSFDSVLSTLTDSEKAQFSQYLLNNTMNSVSTPALQDYIRKFAKSIASLDGGGMIPRGASGGIDGKGARAVFVHPNEIISNPIDTENMVKTSSILERISRFISPITNNGLNMAGAIGGGDIYVSFGDIHNATKEQLNHSVDSSLIQLNVEKEV